MIQVRLLWASALLSLAGSAAAENDLLPCTYSSSDLLMTVQLVCAPYFEVLQSCPGEDVRPVERLAVADQLSSCIDSVVEKLNDNGDYASIPRDTLDFQTAKGCKYPDIFELVSTTCKHGLDTLDYPCTDRNISTVPLGKGRGIDHYAHFRQCQRQTNTQFVRCTLQKSEGEVSDCVKTNGVKATWLNILTEYTGVKKCPSMKSVLVTFTLAVLFATIAPIFGFYFNLLLSKYTARGRKTRAEQEKAWQGAMASARHHEEEMERVYQDKLAREAQEEYRVVNHFEEAKMRECRRRRRRAITTGGTKLRSIDDLAADEPLDSPFRLTRRFTLKALQLTKSVGREILTAFFVSLALSKNSYLGETKMTELLLLYLVRPRAAPFTGLLGLFQPWSQQGFADLVADHFLSFFAGIFIVSRYTGFAGWVPDTDNPAAPLGDLTRLSIGGIVAAFPTLGFIFILALVGFCLGCCMGASDDKDDGGGALCGGVCGSMLLSVGWLLGLVVMIFVLPFIVLIEIVGAVIWMVRRKSGKPEYTKEYRLQFRPSRWIEPLSTTSRGFVVVYVALIVSSFCVNAGNWLFWVSYLKVAGEVFCPVEMYSMEAVVIVVPFAVEVVFWAFRVLTNDPSVGFHVFSG